MIFLKETQILPIVKAISHKYNVPEALILGHIKQESNFDPKAYKAEPQISDASYGLMQLLTGTAKGLDSNATTEKLNDPSYNIDLGTRLIAKNLIRYKGDVKSAIAAYNAGTAYKSPTGEYISKSGNKAVQSYVDKVYKNYVTYSEWLAKGAHEIMVNPMLVASFIGLSILVFGTYLYRRSRYV